MLTSHVCVDGHDDDCGDRENVRRAIARLDETLTTSGFTTLRGDDTYTGVAIAQYEARSAT